HWHPFDNTYRKVKSPCRAICQYESITQKYVRPGMCGLHEIVVKYIAQCCYCGKKRLMIQYIEATFLRELKQAMSYPDLDDEPLVIR
ncbi:hypothetical protein LCGC14_2107560, partial [marine sediment metagenome]